MLTQRLHRGRRRVGIVDVAHGVAAHPAQHRARPSSCSCRSSPRSRCSPRPRSATSGYPGADAVVGADAAGLQQSVTVHPRGARVPGLAVVARHARVQPARRRPARGHRPDAASTHRPPTGAAPSRPIGCDRPARHRTGCGARMSLLEVATSSSASAVSRWSTGVVRSRPAAGSGSSASRDRASRSPRCRDRARPRPRRVSGSIRFDGPRLIGLSDRDASRLRGERIAMVFRSPLTSLNPRHAGRPADRRAAAAAPRSVHGGPPTAEAVALCDRVGLPDPERVARAFPISCPAGSANASASRWRWPAGRRC